MMQEAGTTKTTSYGTANRNGVALEVGLIDAQSNGATPFSERTAADLMTLQQQQVNI